MVDVASTLPQNDSSLICATVGGSSVMFLILYKIFKTRYIISLYSLNDKLIDVICYIMLRSQLRFPIISVLKSSIKRTELILARIVTSAARVLYLFGDCVVHLIRYTNKACNLR